MNPKDSKISTFGKRISSLFASKWLAEAAVKSSALEEKSSASVQKLVQKLV